MATNKNRLEIRLDPESQSLLDSLVVRTALTKTSLIKIALKVYASTLKSGHIYTIRLKGQENKKDEETIKDEELEEMYRISKTPWLDDKNNEDD